MGMPTRVLRRSDHSPGWLPKPAGAPSFRPEVASGLAALADTPQSTVRERFPGSMAFADRPHPGHVHVHVHARLGADRFSARPAPNKGTGRAAAALVPGAARATP